MSAPGAGDADRIAELLSRHYREPTRQRAQALAAAQPPDRQDAVLRFALELPVALADPALRGRAATVRLAREAVFYMRRWFTRDDATHYEVLGLNPAASAAAVRANFRLLMRLIHPDRQGEEPRWPEAFAARVNRAYSVLKSPDTRAAYDRELAERAGDGIARAVAVGRSGPRDRRRRRAPAEPPSPTPTLPEWLTVGVGGYVREHPALSSLLAIVVGSASIIGAVAWETREAVVAREARPEVAATRRTAVAEGPAPTDSVAHPNPDPPIAPSGRTAEGTAGVATPAAPPALPATAPVAKAPAMATALSSPPARSGAPAATAPVVVTVASAPPVRIEPTTAPAAAVKPGGESVPEVAAIAIAMPAMPVTAEAVPVGPPPATGEIETFFAAFVDAYEKGRPDAMAALFDDDAETNARRGRAAIRGEYDELFRQSSWRRMQLARMNWRRVGDRALAKGEVSMRIGWRDGREVEQRVAMDVELVRRDGRAVIAKLSQQPRN